MVILVAGAGCKPSHRHYRNLEAPETVHLYKAHPANTTDADDWVYWYVILHNNHYYYYSSSTPVTDFSGANWTTSVTAPAEISGAESIGTESVAGTSLGADFATEGSAADVASEAPASDMSSESGANDSSGSDSSGGDSGGDGGGGGDGGE